MPRSTLAFTAWETVGAVIIGLCFAATSALLLSAAAGLAGSLIFATCFAVNLKQAVSKKGVVLSSLATLTGGGLIGLTVFKLALSGSLGITSVISGAILIIYGLTLSYVSELTPT